MRHHIEFIQKRFSPVILILVVMKILKFKTDVVNQDMLAKIAPALDQEKMISKWNLEPESEDHILSVSGEEITPAVVAKVLQEKGFQAILIRVQGIGGHDL
jgi:copper chaperone